MLEYRMGIAIDLSNIATIYKAMGEVDKASDYQQRAEKIYKILAETR